MRKANNYGKVNVVENDKYQYGVTDNDGNVIVPFGKYGWISGFEHGLARVKSIQGLLRFNSKTGTVENPKWGIIDMDGNEVLSVEYDEIWNFLGKGRSSTKVVKDGESYDFDFDSLQLQYPVPRGYRYSHYDDNYDEDPMSDYGTSYGRYAGSYAQDVMGFSDEAIDDAFEGDPDAYWNID